MMYHLSSLLKVSPMKNQFICSKFLCFLLIYDMFIGLYLKKCSGDLRRVLWEWVTYASCIICIVHITISSVHNKAWHANWPSCVYLCFHYKRNGGIQSIRFNSIFTHILSNKKVIYKTLEWSYSDFQQSMVDLKTLCPQL